MDTKLTTKNKIFMVIRVILWIVVAFFVVKVLYANFYVSQSDIQGAFPTEDIRKKFITGGKSTDARRNQDPYYLDEEGKVRYGKSMGIEIDEDSYEMIVFHEMNVDKYRFSDDEFDYFCRCVEAEAGTTTTKCRRAIAEAILNQLDSEDYPNNIIDVINKRNAFQVVANKSINTVTVQDTTVDVCKAAMTEDRKYPTDMTVFRLRHYHPFATDYMNMEGIYFSRL